MSVLDEARFGPERTLDLHIDLPSAAEAERRAEMFLRQRQIAGDREALIITGRGSHSPGGIPVVKNAVEKLLYKLRRQGVVAAHREHNPGAWEVDLAPLRSLSDAPRRRRDKPRPQPVVELHGLGPRTLEQLRRLAECSLDALGAKATEARVTDEMHRQLRALIPGLGGGPDFERRLEEALERAIAEYD